VGVNRVGQGDGLDYVGDSAVIDPWGEVLASGASVEALLVVDIDASTVEKTRSDFPVLQDRRT
jgi:predicted amidohydrolase